MDEELIEVAPGVFMTQDDLDANMAYDEMRDNEIEL
jgi:AmiR/NasT family two-component response regulator